MSSRRNLIYFVEGETEEKLVKVLRTEMLYIRPGRVIIHNVIQKILRTSMLLALEREADLAFVFDTDCCKTEILEKNIEIIKGNSRRRKIYLIPQVLNLEDELRFSCGITDIREITGSRSQKDFKRDFLRLSNLAEKLSELKFDISKMWTRQPSGKFRGLTNDSEKIKLSD